MDVRIANDSVFSKDKGKTRGVESESGGFLDPSGRATSPEQLEEQLEEQPEEQLEEQLEEDDVSVVLPVVEEEVHVEKKKVATGKVRIRKNVEEKDVELAPSLLSEEVEIDRIEKNETIEAVPPSRYEGETLVIPVVEEVLEVRKRLVLKEEIHVRKRSRMTEEPVTARIRKESIEIDRVPAAETASEDKSTEGVEPWTRQF